MATETTPKVTEEAVEQFAEAQAARIEAGLHGLNEASRQALREMIRPGARADLEAAAGLLYKAWAEELRADLIRWSRAANHEAFRGHQRGEISYKQYTAVESTHAALEGKLREALPSQNPDPLPVNQEQHDEGHLGDEDDRRHIDRLRETASQQLASADGFEQLAGEENNRLADRLEREWFPDPNQEADRGKD